MGHKEDKERYFRRVYYKAPIVECACGCGTKLRSKDSYGRSKKYICGHNGRKYSDPTEYKRAWNHRNRKNRYNYKKEYAHRRKVQILEMLGTNCIVCFVKYSGKNASMFDFHHKDPSLKKFGLGLTTLQNMAWEKIIVEAKKCDVLCSNCHRLLHSSEY